MYKELFPVTRYIAVMSNRKKLSGVGPILRAFRLEASLSQDVLADRLDVSASFISMLENGKRYPSIEMLIRLSIALEVPAGDILNRIAEQYIPSENCFPWTRGVQ